MLREKIMKNIVLLGLLSTIMFVGCSSKTIEIVKEKQEQKREVKIELSVEDINAQKELEEEKKKVELKKKLDEEALTNSDKKLNSDEIDSYVIDESTPLILKNQSKERAYE
jgi:uncharacterized membrane protein